MLPFPCTKKVDVKMFWWAYPSVLMNPQKVSAVSRTSVILTWMPPRGIWFPLVYCCSKEATEMRQKWITSGRMRHGFSHKKFSEWCWNLNIYKKIAVLFCFAESSKSYCLITFWFVNTESLNAKTFGQQTFLLS